MCASTFSNAHTHTHTHRRATLTHADWQMATAHAYRWSRYGIKVFIGSRDPAKGKRLAAKIGGCQGGGHVEMIGASNFLILCIPPGPPSLAFIDQHREELVGKGKMFVDLSASFTRSAAACSEPTWLNRFRPSEMDHFTSLAGSTPTRNGPRRRATRTSCGCASG